MSPNHLISGAAIALFCASASASIFPVFDTFGPLPEATFGGTGIPNDEVAASRQIVDGDTTITIALSATQRFSNPALTNDSAGTYFAGPGSNDGTPGSTTGLVGSLWNFNYYIDAVDGMGNPVPLSDYQFNLFYDFDPAADTAINDLGNIDITASLLAAMNTTGGVQGSENLNFSFLATSVPGFLTAPGGSFDPNALGEYTFALGVSLGGGFPLDSVGINVEVIPSASTLALLAPAGLLASRRRRRA